MATRPAEAVRTGTDQEWRKPGLVTGALSEQPVPGTGSPMRWFFSGVWLVYLIQPVANLFGHHHGVAWIAGGLAITVAFCVIYMLVLMYSDEQPRLAKYAADLGLKKLAVLYLNTDWGRTSQKVFSEAAKANGAEIVDAGGMLK